MSAHRLQTPKVSYVGQVQLLVGQETGISGPVPLPKGTGREPLPECRSTH